MADPIPMERPARIEHIEQWVPVKGFEDLYEVSSHGRLKALAKTIRCSSAVSGKRRIPERILSPHLQKGDRFTARLFRNGRLERATGLSRLICEAFNGPPPFPEAKCLHWNDVGTDNRPSNLRWGTSRDNTDDAMRNGRCPMGENHGRAILTEANVRDARRRHAGGETVASIARSYGVLHAAATRAIRGITWKHVL